MDTKDKKAFFKHRYYNVNKFLLSIVGLWPFQTNFGGKFLRVFNEVVVGSQLLTESFAVFTLWGDSDAVMECLTPLLTNMICVTKFICSVYHNDKMQAILLRIPKDWDILEAPGEIEILRKFAEHGRSLSIAYAISLGSCVGAFMFAPVVRRILRENTTVTQPDELTFRVEYFVDVDEYYYFILLHCTWAIGTCVLVAIAADAMLCTLIEHLGGIVQAAGYRMEQAFGDDVPEEEAYKSLCYCVRQHQNVIEFVDILESIYPTSFLCQLGFNMIVISLAAIQITEVKDMQTTLRYAAYIGAQTVHLFFECWVAQGVIDYTDKVRTLAYDANWYKGSTRCKQQILLIMLRSGTFSKLSAGKIATMSIATFGAVCRTSGSYYTVLRSVD